MIFPGALVTYGGIFDVEVKQEEIKELEEQMGLQGFWDNQEKAKKVTTQSTQLKQVISPLLDFRKKLDDLQVLSELVAESSEEEASLYELEIEETLSSVYKPLADRVERNITQYVERLEGTAEHSNDEEGFARSRSRSSPTCVPAGCSAGIALCLVLICSTP